MTVAPRPQTVRFGQLDCWVVDGGSQADIPVVLCHGYGAPGSDLVGIAFEWMEELGSISERFQFIFPTAVSDLAALGMPDGRAWWPINMARLMEAVQADRFDELHALEPPGMAESRQLLVEAIEAMQAELARRSNTDQPRRLVLGGFSQGAMLTMDTALRGLPEPPQVLLQFSGTLVCQNAWAAHLGKLASTRVYQSHGTADPILPFSSAVALRELLTEANVELTFHAFPGGHTIDRIALQQTASLLADLAQADV